MLLHRYVVGIVRHISTRLPLGERALTIQHNHSSGLVSPSCTEMIMVANILGCARTHATCISPATPVGRWKEPGHPPTPMAAPTLLGRWFVLVHVLTKGQGKICVLPSWPGSYHPTGQGVSFFCFLFFENNIAKKNARFRERNVLYSDTCRRAVPINSMLTNHAARHGCFEKSYTTFQKVTLLSCRDLTAQWKADSY